ncbi:hypothetical protein GCM10020221_31110 [Streptomyces thioluteus]|uniref:MFS transporter n=1 Tax=Streptomyces thioluteus TaxID=66431 RepID=A0ABN3WZS4_STRTU
MQNRDPLEAGLAELPARHRRAVTAGLLAGQAARRWSVRGVVSGGLAAIGTALAVLGWLSTGTAYPLLGAVLLVVGVGAGFSFTVTADVILSSVPKEQAGAASAVSETAYELGAALGIALLGSIVTGVYRGFTVPAGVPEAPAARRARVAGRRRQGGGDAAGRHGLGAALLGPARLRGRAADRLRRRRGGAAEHGGGRVVPAARTAAGRGRGRALSEVRAH